MKNNIAKILVFSAALAASASISFAATISLTNGGLGQVAANPQQFGVAVCNNSAQAFTSSVPVTVTIGSQTVTVSSAPSIAAGQCQYSYLNYSQFDMQAGQNYSATVTIDPQHTLTSGVNNETTYNVTVPATAGASATGNLSANASENVSSNIFVSFWNWLKGLF